MLKALLQVPSFRSNFQLALGAATCRPLFVAARWAAQQGLSGRGHPTGQLRGLYQDVPRTVLGLQLAHCTQYCTHRSAEKHDVRQGTDTAKGFG